MIFTQLDKFLGAIRVKLTLERPNVSTEDIELLVDAEFKRKLNDDYIKPLCQITKNNNYPHAVVSSRVSLKSQPSNANLKRPAYVPHGETVRGLVQTTQ